MTDTEPIVFLNGSLVPESQAGIPIRDRGFIYGDAVFDAARTFGGTPFKLTEHVKRLYDSLRYVRIDPGIGMKEMEEWSRKVVEHNYPLLPPGQDMWVMQRVTRGVEGGEGENSPTVLIESHAIPFVAPGAALPGRGAGHHSVRASRTTSFHEPKGQDAQLPEPGAG